MRDEIVARAFLGVDPCGDRHEGRAFSYDCVETGWNFRIDEMRSSLALAQLERLPEFAERRRDVRRWYLEELDGADVGVPFTKWDGRESEGIRIGYHVMPVLLTPSADRAAVMAHMKEHNLLRNSPEFLLADEEIQNMVNEHCALHEQVIQAMLEQQMAQTEAARGGPGEKGEASQPGQGGRKQRKTGGPNGQENKQEGGGAEGQPGGGGGPPA